MILSVLCPRCYRPAESLPDQTGEHVLECVRCLACGRDYVRLFVVGWVVSANVPDDVMSAALERCICANRLAHGEGFDLACPIHVRSRLPMDATRMTAKRFLAESVRDPRGVEAEDVFRAWLLFAKGST